MVCQFVWKSQQDSSKKSDDKDNNKDSELLPKSAEEGGENDEGKESYDDYRKRYCLNYVRSFFNTHMDDSWFRSRYSPLGKKRGVMSERERAKHEAQVFQSQMEASLKEEGAAAEGERCCFVQQARLGGGVKTASSTGNTEIPVPKTHALSIANPDHVLHISDVPPHVTDEQLALALMDHCMIPADEQAAGSPVPEGIKLVSGTVSPSADRPKNPLWRDAFFICSAAVKQDIVTHLNKAEDEGDQATAADKSSDNIKSEEPAVVVPRKGERDGKIRVIIPLDVECSDPYGRLDVDSDGKGGAPEDGVGVPPRKSTVWVNTQYKAPAVTALSAAISSKERLGQDKEAAIKMAQALDVAKDIPEGLRLDQVLDGLFGVDRNTEEASDPSLIEDTLDVAIAYLRRVHLFSFYNGCTFATNVADVLSGKHAAGTIHMRLKNADEILAEDKSPAPVKTEDDTPAPPPPKDLLVSRLDASIEKALAACNDWVKAGGATIVSEVEDQEAAAIEQAEDEWKATWLENHAIIDDDGRARCSFHFCHKLFKDTTFLRKHLQKKHNEFLRAEQAQLHDEYMMKAWDAEEKRPVPPVLVDCGANFDLVPSPVVGAEPMTVDPEPELWRKEEERRKHEEEMQQQRQEERRQNRDRRPDHRSDHHHPLPGADERKNTPRERPVKNFVDVDDMKEEKVEMSFDNIDVPVLPPKKKKRKKKLL